MTYYLQVYQHYFNIVSYIMMIGSKMFQDEFMKINNILSGIRNNYICSEVKLYKMLCECQY